VVNDLTSEHGKSSTDFSYILMVRHLSTSITTIFFIQIFAFERFKCFRDMYNVAKPCKFPLMVGWLEITTHKAYKSRACNESSTLVSTHLEKLQAITDEDVSFLHIKGGLVL
jgi:hypothetical protein